MAKRASKKTSTSSCRGLPGLPGRGGMSVCTLLDYIRVTNLIG